MQTTINVNSFKKIIRQTIKESVKEAMEIEIIKFRAELLPYISDKEQNEIDTLYGSPENKPVKNFEVKL